MDVALLGFWRPGTVTRMKSIDRSIWGHFGSGRSNVFAVVDGVMCTPPLDGRQLAGGTPRGDA